MKTIKELEADLKGIICGNRIFKRGKIKALKDVLGLIDEDKKIYEILQEVFMEGKDCSSAEKEIKEELKARIEGTSENTTNGK